MNDLVAKQTIDEIKKAYPNFFDGFRKAKSIIDSIQSFSDIETHLLKGAGLAASTYKGYMTAIRQLYNHTGGLNPFQITPGHIEDFYDTWSKKVDRNTAAKKIHGLKRFFNGIGQLCPGYISPFDVMAEKLTKKLSRTKKGKTKKALSLNELKSLLDWLREDTSVKGQCIYSIVFMLATSGLRISELTGLQWKDLSFYEGAWTASFIGKGDKPADQELYNPSVEAVLNYFKQLFSRDPRPDDFLFYTFTDPIRQHDPHSVWYQLRRIGALARKKGIIKRELQFSPHLFRRTYASVLNKAGMKLKAIMEKTRHSNIEVLAKHYIDDSEPATPYFDKVLGA